jgi:hypothetical protein
MEKEFILKMDNFNNLQNNNQSIIATKNILNITKMNLKNCLNF